MILCSTEAAPQVTCFWTQSPDPWLSLLMGHGDVQGVSPETPSFLTAESESLPRVVGIAKSTAKLSGRLRWFLVSPKIRGVLVT